MPDLRLRLDLRSRYRDTLIVSTFHYVCSPTNPAVNPLLELSALFLANVEDPYVGLVSDRFLLQRRIVYLIDPDPNKRESVTFDLGNRPGLELNACVPPWICFGIYRAPQAHSRRYAGHLWMTGFAQSQIVNGARPLEPMPGVGSRLLADRMRQTLFGVDPPGGIGNQYSPVVVSRRRPFQADGGYRFRPASITVPTPSVKVRRSRTARPDGRPDPGLLPG